MKVSSGPVTKNEALDAANEMEKVLSEIANGKRKPQNIPMEPLVALIQFARDTRPAVDWISVLDSGLIVFDRCTWAYSNGDSDASTVQANLKAVGGDGAALARVSAGCNGDLEAIRFMISNSGAKNA